MLSKAKDTSIAGMAETGICPVEAWQGSPAQAGRTSRRLGPGTDARLTAWEMVHQLIRALEANGESAAASLLAKLGSKAEIARELAYRLYTIASARNARPRRCRTTDWCRVGRKSRA